MIAACQFCGLILDAYEIRQAVALDEAAALAELAENYRKLAALVSAHMSGAHARDPVAREVMGAMFAAGSAVAMRYVSSSDNRVEGMRLEAAQHLVELFNTAPVAPVATAF